MALLFKINIFNSFKSRCFNKALFNNYYFINNVNSKCHKSSSNSSSGVASGSGGVNDCNNFKGYLISKIKMKGPITVSEYMKEALGNPQWGYYMTRDVFGAKGDFTTSPEVSQLFGELIGIWFLNEWFTLKEVYGKDFPVSVNLCEFGPGRGTLMNDVLRVFNKVEPITRDLNVYLIETSPYLRKVQSQNLCDIRKTPDSLAAHKHKQFKNINIIWLDDICELPKREAAHFFLANEFFDALPTHLFKRFDNTFKEILIDFDEKTNKLKFIASPKLTVASKMLLKLHPNHKNYDHVELSIEGARIMETIVTKLLEYNGSILVIDYGHNGEHRDSFRGFKSHKLCDPLEDPGNCDLTVDVDFSFLASISKDLGAVCYGPTTQSEFLHKMQIKTRVDMLLAKCKNDDERKTIQSEYDMLTNKEKMGERFKLLSIRKFDLEREVPGFTNIKPKN